MVTSFAPRGFVAGASAVAALCLLAAPAVSEPLVVKRQAPQEADPNKAQDAEGAGRNTVIALHSIRTCPEVTDEGDLAGYVKDITLQRSSSTEYVASGEIEQRVTIECADRFAMNCTLYKQEGDDQTSLTPIAQFGTENVTKLIEEHPDKTASFFEHSNFPNSCPFELNTYELSKFSFDVKPVMKFLPDAVYKVVLKAHVNDEMKYCVEIEFGVRTVEDEEEEEEDEKK